MKPSPKTLSDKDFPLRTNGDKLVRRDGTVIATALDAELARDIADRLNRDQDKRHEESWSA